VPLYRDGGQAQFIDTPIPVLDDRHLFADTLTWLQSHLDQSVSVRDLAERAAMSPRTFARRFLSSTGLTPYQWIVRERIRLAQRLLETSDLPVDAIAVKTGFATAGNLRKHFSRTVRTSPHAYRDSFRRSATSR
jgi:AraC family transcriptional activator FtrA